MSTRPRWHPLAGKESKEGRGGRVRAGAPLQFFSLIGSEISSAALCHRKEITNEKDADCPHCHSSAGLISELDGKCNSRSPTPHFPRIPCWDRVQKIVVPMGIASIATMEAASHVGSKDMGRDTGIGTTGITSRGATETMTSAIMPQGDTLASTTSAFFFRLTRSLLSGFFLEHRDPSAVRRSSRIGLDEHLPSAVASVAVRYFQEHHFSPLPPGRPWS
jgi:hypothetical protein